MASLDDDEEILPEVVSEYYFYDAEDEPVSFTELPVQWSNGERSDDNKSQIYLRGKTDNGLLRLHKQVKAWKYEFLIAKLEISVLSKDNYWIKLQTPRKSFESKIRTILITMQCLHFLWRKPKASCKALWDHLRKVFSLYDIRPSENDLMDHLKFIREAVKRDNTLQRSKFLASLLKGRSKKSRPFDLNAKAIMKPSFIVDDRVCEYMDNELTIKRSEDSESDSESDNDVDDDNDEDDIFDDVCAICDNGGDLTCCEGKCLRSFHATHKSAKSAKSSCKSLGLRPEEVKGSQPFVCLNCSHEQHQCFVCGKLGSSNKSYGTEVFRCSSATCGHFYHPACVAKLLEAESDIEARNLEEKIAGGEPFTCPAHTCHKCKQGEDEKVKGLQFAVCRRCPRSYHRKCLPSKIMFYNKCYDRDVIARAWNNLLPKSRALIYCLKHKMDPELCTPVRNLKFPEISHCSKNMTFNEDVVSSDNKSDEIAEMSSGSECVTNMSIEAERDSKTDHIPVDEDEQTAIVTENDKFPSDVNSRGRILALMKDFSSSLTLDMVERHYNQESDYKSTAYARGHHDSGFSSKYMLADTDRSSYNRFSSLVMNQYTPKLDELNHEWMMKNKRLGVYDRPVGQRMDDSRFAPRWYYPFSHHHRHHPPPQRYKHHNVPRRYKQRHVPRHYQDHPISYHKSWDGRMDE